MLVRLNGAASTQKAELPTPNASSSYQTKVLARLILYHKSPLEGSVGAVAPILTAPPPPPPPPPPAMLMLTVFPTASNVLPAPIKLS